MVFYIPTHHLGINALLNFTKLVGDIKGINILNVDLNEDRWHSCRSRSLRSWVPLKQKSHSNNMDFDSAKCKVPLIYSEQWW